MSNISLFLYVFFRLTSRFFSRHEAAGTRSFFHWKTVPLRKLCISALRSFRFEFITEHILNKFMIRTVCYFHEKARSLTLHWDQVIVDKIFEQKTFV